MANAGARNKEFLRREEIARRLNVSVRTVDRWIERKLLPIYKVGNTVLFEWVEVGDFVRQNFSVTPRKVQLNSPARE